MKAGPAQRRPRADPGVADDAGERGLHGVVDQALTGRGDEEARRPGAGIQLAAPLRVGPERGQGAGVQRDLPTLAELGIPYGQYALVPVDVVPVQAEHLAGPHARRAQQADQRLVGGGANRRGERAGRAHQRGDVSVGIQVGGGPAFRPGEQPGRRHLGGRVESLQVAGEAPHCAQPVAQVGRVSVVSRQRGPGQRQLGGDGGRAGCLQVGDEVLQQPGVALEPGTQRAAHRDVVAGRLAQLDHRAPPGQGRARRRSATRSTLAYKLVVAGRAWRSTCPTSASDAPPASMAVAA